MTKPSPTANELPAPEPQDDPLQPQPKPASWDGLWFFLVLMTVLLSIILLPKILRLVSGLGKPVAGVYLGSVQKVTYIGGFGLRTQIDTDNQTFLLSGAVQVNKGTRLELRRGIIFDAEVCEVGTRSCRNLISH